MTETNIEVAAKLARKAYVEVIPELFEGDENEPTKFMKSELLPFYTRTVDTLLEQLCINQREAIRQETRKETGQNDQDNFEKKLQQCKEYAEKHKDQKTVNFINSIFDQYWTNKPKIEKGELHYKFPLSPPQREKIEECHRDWYGNGD
jgi:hypothetical protein